MKFEDFYWKLAIKIYITQNGMKTIGDKNLRFWIRLAKIKVKNVEQKDVEPLPPTRKKKSRRNLNDDEFSHL